MTVTQRPSSPPAKSQAPTGRIGLTRLSRLTWLAQIEVLATRFFKPLTWLVIGLALFWRLNSLDWPAHYQFDEDLHAFTAWRITQADERVFEWWHPPLLGEGESRYLYRAPAIEWLHPPLSRYFQALFITLLGNQPFAWRLPSALLGTGVVILGIILSRRLSGSATLALSLGIILSLEPLTRAQSQIASPDIYLTFFVLLAATNYWHWRSKPSGLRLISVGLATGLALASKWPGGLLLLGFLVFELSASWLECRQAKCQEASQASTKSPDQINRQVDTQAEIDQTRWPKPKRIQLALEKHQSTPETIKLERARLAEAVNAREETRGEQLENKNTPVEKMVNQSLAQISRGEKTDPNSNSIFSKGRALLIISAISALLYCIVYIPALFAGKTFTHLVAWQRAIWAYQTEADFAHPHQSRPLSWLWGEKPVWYAFEITESGQARERVAKTWPALGLICLTGCALALLSARRRRAPLFPRYLPSLYFLSLSLALWLPWFFVSRPLFLYQFTPVVPLLLIAFVTSLPRAFSTNEVK